MRDLPKFNYTRAQMVDSIYHMTLRLLFILISDVKKSFNFIITLNRNFANGVYAGIFSLDNFHRREAIIYV